MAYVGNVVAFIKHRIEKAEIGYYVFNYSDKPDLSMSELTSFVEKKMSLNISKINIPFWIGILGGYAFDFFAFISGRKLTISSVRVKKFCSTTQFDSSKAHSEFKAPYTLKEGLNRTLEHEFINPKKDNELYYTE